MKSELVAVSKQDIVGCIPDAIPSFHCCANLISVSMTVEQGNTNIHGLLYGIA